MTERASVVLWLDEVTDGDRERVGGKAAGLARLRQAGLPVPDGFVIPAGLDPAGTAAAQAYARMQGQVAVRSSAAHEDGEELSFAGQYRSELRIEGAADVSAAVARCRGAEHAGVGYAQALGGAPLGELAVLVQRYVPARAAGVVFTRHPQDPACLLVESHAGTGEALVSGLVTPDRYVLDRATLALREAPSGSLSAEEVRAMARLALAAEKAFGGPQDVEWVLDEAGRFALVQSRPITVEPEAPRDPRLHRLTRANVGEVLPDPVTPLTWTTVGHFLEQAFRKSTGDLGLVAGDPPPFLVLHQERVYLNLSLCLEVAQGIPGVSAQDAAALVLGGSGAPEAAAASSRVAAFLKGLPRAISIVMRVLREARALPGRITRAEKRLAALVLPAPGAAAMDLRRALDEFTDAGETIAHAHVAASGASGVRLAVLARLLGWRAPGDPRALVNRLVAGLDGVESALPTAALEHLAADAAREPEWREWLRRPADDREGDWAAGRLPPGLQERLREFLARYGHRAMSEGELRTATWADIPAPVFSVLAQLAETAREPSFSREARGAARQADEEALRSRLGFLVRPLLDSAIHGAQEWVRVRERTKSLSVRLVDHGRRLARAAAALLVAEGRLTREDDVYFLTACELRSLLDGKRVSLPMLARRRRRHAQAAQVPASREVDLTAAAAATEAGDAVGEVWQGLGVSAGVAVGRARVVGAGMLASLDAGEVLIAPVLDAAWGPHLSMAAGAVAEMGGMLSHGAVVARELGVPCVVDVPGATRLLRTGDAVLVDGSTGRVQRLSGDETDGASRGPSPLHPEARAEDERFHPLEAHPLARESVYMNVQDPRSGLSLVASLGVRPRGRGEALLALAMPGGDRLFGVTLARFATDSQGVAVRGARYDFSPLRLRFAGRLARYAAAGFPPAPLPLLLRRRSAAVQLDLAFTATTPAIDFCATLSPEELAHLAPLGAHHVEQSGTWEGHLEVDGRVVPIKGTGSRDHSWGLRDWNAADWWRLFTMRFGQDLAIHALVVSVGGHWVEGGFILRGGRIERLTRVQFRPRFEGRRLLTVDLECASAAGPPLLVHGTVERTITVPVQLSRRPLRHLQGRPYTLLLHENFTRYEAAGFTGHGMAEFTERP